MPDIIAPALCRFDNFLLDRQARGLFRLHPDGGRSAVQIGARAFQILCLLVERRGEIVSRREIMDAVWPNVTVEQNNLTVQLATLRRLLDADREHGSCIQNITGRGYRFVPAVTDELPPGRGPLAQSASADAGAPRDDEEAQPTTTATGSQAAAGAWQRYKVRIITACVCTAALATITGWYVHSTASIQAQRGTPPVASANAASKERPRLSLIVLPFTNLRGEGMDDSTVDAITVDLTSDLARVYGLFVIGRSSAFTYKGKPVDIKRVGDEMGVRYVVEGSVRKADGALRANVQLVSTETGAQVWSDHFGIERDGISFTVDDIVRQIGHTLSDRITESESTRGARERPANPNVADLVLHARALQDIPPNPQRQYEIIALYERAVELDPESATALAGLAEALEDSIYTYEDPTTPEKFRRAEEFVTRAERLRPNDMPVMFARMNLLMAQGRCSDVIAAAQRMIAVYPNVTSSHMCLGICLMFDGRSADAIPEYEQTIRLDPRNARIFTRYLLMGYALLFLERYDEAVVWFQKSLAANPSDSPRHRGNMRAAIAAAQALAAHNEDARASAAEAMRLFPTLTARGYYHYKITSPIIAAQVSRMRDGLRLAGVRDHADEDADADLPSDEALHTEYEAPTPVTVPGARIIRTPDLPALIEQRRPVVIDSNPWGRSIPDAIGLWGAGIGGDLSDGFQERLGRKMQQLTGGDRTVPVVAMGWNAERFQGRNLALRLAALGYTEVYSYRGGREAWEAAGLATTELAVQNW